MFDLNLYPQGLSDQDLDSMRYFGLQSALACPHSLHGPTVRALLASFEEVRHRQLERLRRAGIRGYVALGVHPASLPRRGLSTVLSELPSLFGGGHVVAVGPIGLLKGSAEEEEALVEQLRLARRLKLPVLLQTPAPQKEHITRRTLALLKTTGVSPSRALVCRANARTVRPILACGLYAGMTLHPDEMEAEQAVALVRKLGARRLAVSSSAGEGAGDILVLPRLAHLLEKMQLSKRVISRVMTTNAEDFLRLSPT
jgi:uncharacterized protein